MFVRVKYSIKNDILPTIFEFFIYLIFWILPNDIKNERWNIMHKFNTLLAVFQNQSISKPAFLEANLHTKGFIPLLAGKTSSTIFPCYKLVARVACFSRNSHMNIGWLTWVHCIWKFNSATTLNSKEIQHQEFQNELDVDKVSKATVKIWNIGEVLNFSTSWNTKMRYWDTFNQINLKYWISNATVDKKNPKILKSIQSYILF